MDFEIKFEQISKKFGEQFNWYYVNAINDSYMNQANRELSARHCLYNKIVKTLAKCESNDDVLFYLKDNQFAIVHLTYSSNDDLYTRFEIFNNLNDLFGYIEKKYIQDYL